MCRRSVRFMLRSLPLKERAFRVPKFCALVPEASRRQTSTKRTGGAVGSISRSSGRSLRDVRFEETGRTKLFPTLLMRGVPIHLALCFPALVVQLCRLGEGECVSSAR